MVVKAHFEHWNKGPQVEYRHYKLMLHPCQWFCIRHEQDIHMVGLIVHVWTARAKRAHWNCVAGMLNLYKHDVSIRLLGTCNLWGNSFSKPSVILGGSTWSGTNGRSISPVRYKSCTDSWRNNVERNAVSKQVDTLNTKFNWWRKIENDTNNQAGSEEWHKAWKFKLWSSSCYLVWR